MDPNVNAWLEMLFRWIHVVAGIAWIGLLYFFNFVNSQVVKTYDADSKRKVVPELMPRVLTGSAGAPPGPGSRGSCWRDSSTT